MNALINSQNLNLALDVTGWSAAFGGPGHGGRSSRLGGSMGDASPPTAPAPAPARSPRHQRKRRRLSRLLDRLAVQFRNNNHYPCPRWLALDTPTDAKEPEDVPLDLSVKSETVPRTGEKDSDYACVTCGQTFAVRDRLVKHVASRHRTRAPEAGPGSGPGVGPGRSYECEVCFRKFARSDMLTRHARLHSGVKPYACAACGQVFSRSDHLATHQRTHTGEKPYRCPVCAYAACRRDMITRHMRTHARRSQPAPAPA